MSERGGFDARKVHIAPLTLLMRKGAEDVFLRSYRAGNRACDRRGGRPGPLALVAADVRRLYSAGGGSRLGGQGWTCRCAREPGVAYAVNFAGCDCPDCAGRHAELHGEAFCPHRLALLALCDICLAHVRERRLGLTKDPVARTAAREAPNAGLLLMRYDGGHKLALVTASARGLLHVPVCQMANVEGRLGFASERDLAAFAAWLGQAGPLAPARILPLPQRPPASLAHLAVLAA